MRIVIWISLVLCAAGYICGPLDDPDLWWHITIGRWIVSHRQVPQVDYWSLFGNGQPWRAYSWSFEVLCALIERGFGLSGLIVIKIVMTLGLAFSAQYVFVKMSRSLGCGSLLATLYTISCFNHITLRPQTFIWMIFIWLLYVAHQISQQGSSKRRLAVLCALMCLWANIHLSAVLGLALVFTWIAKQGAGMTALKATGAAFAGTLITPYFGGEWLTFFNTSAHPFSFSLISEFQPATILQYSTAFPLLLVVLLISVAAKRPAIQPLLRWLLAGTFLIGAFAVLKFVPFLMVIFCGLTAVLWSCFPDKKSLPIFEGIERLIILIEERMPREGLSFVLIVLAVIYFYRPVKNPLNNDITPVSAMNFIEQYKLPSPIMNSFGQGGYVMYRLSDQNGELTERPSIDGRTNLISPDLWKMHTRTLQGGFGWEKYIELVKPGTILWKAESPLTSILRNNNEWCHVFLAGDYDQGQVVFIRREEFEKRRDQLNADNCWQG